MENRSKLFVLLFFLYLLSITFVLRIESIDQNLVLPYTNFLAGLSAGVLNLLGYTVAAQGTTLSQPGFAVDIRRGCDGLVASMVLVSALLAYPLAWRDRLVGSILGFGIIFVLNLLRILGLFLLGASGFRQAFDFGHTYVSQFAVIAFTMIFWIFWIGRDRGERA